MSRPRVQNDRQLAPRVFELLVKIENTHKINGFQSKMSPQKSRADHQKGETNHPEMIQKVTSTSNFKKQVDPSDLNKYTIKAYAFERTLSWK